jgi:plastocyanin
VNRSSRGTAVSLVVILAVTAGSWTGTATAAPAPAAALGETHVEVTDFRFEPSEPLVELGGTVTFDFLGPSHHTATDASGLGLYDSGSVGAGGPSTSFSFIAAGVYRFTCLPHPWMGGRVNVPPTASPSIGSLGSTFTVTWAATRAPSGFVYDVQRRRLGLPWSNWRTSTLARQRRLGTRVTGVVLFRARLRELGVGAATWSQHTSISVS